MTQMVLALVLFVLMYVFLLSVNAEKRYLIALIFAIVFIATGLITLNDGLKAVNWNVIMMLTGTMAVVELFIQSKMPSYMAEKLLMKVPNVKVAVIVLCVFSGLVSAFVDNVATVLMLAPVALAVCEELKINPIPVIISIAVSSNLQGAATLVGDTTSILLGSYANLSFNDFFWLNGKPGISFAVELGAIMTIPVLMWIFKDHKEPIHTTVNTVVEDKVPTILMASVILGLIIASQFENKHPLTNGFICIGLAVIGCVYEWIKTKDRNVFKVVVNAIDYRTLLLLIGLFMVIEGISQAGLIDAIANTFMKVGGDSIFVMYTMIVFVSVIISGFIDNIPYVATMLPVVTSIASMMHISPYLFDFGLLIGATLGGNITPVGASTNIAAIGILQKHGYKVSTKDFVKIGIPFTLVAVVTGYLFIWFVWM